MCTPAVTFTDENSESESDSDDRFKGEAWNPFPALAVESPPLLCMYSSHIPSWPALEGPQAGRIAADGAKSSREVPSYCMQGSPMTVELRQPPSPGLPQGIVRENWVLICLVNAANLEGQKWV